MPYKDPAAKKANDRRYYEEHRDAFAERNRSARNADPAGAAAYRAAWYAANRERERAKRRAYYRANADRLKAASSARHHAKKVDPEWVAAEKARKALYEEQNREAVRASRRARAPRYREINNDHARLRRARLADVSAELVRRSVVWERDRGVCHICGEPADPDDWHLEHVIPIARGGAHAYSNVAVSHPVCNLRKGAR